LKTPILAFQSAADFSLWLEDNHATHLGIWLRIFKKASGQPTVTYAEALDEALCFGWIDGQKQKGDEDSWLQKFTPRGTRSVWSKVNTGHVERLDREGRLRPAGKAAIEAAKADGRWERAYHSSSTFEMPEDFLHELRKFPSALEFYESLNKTNRYAIFYRLQSAKRPETRQRRLWEFVEMLKRGEKLH
jgi:uncharacterized protein YdeI (YjbR/CyaY-like superfamily)